MKKLIKFIKKFIKWYKRNKEDIEFIREGVIFTGFMTLLVYGLAFIGLIYK